MQINSCLRFQGVLSILLEKKHIFVGDCQCIDPYFGPTCEAEKSQAPKLSPRAFDGLCDTRVKPCHKYMITGLNFMEGSLKCKYRHFTVSVYFNLILNRNLSVS